MTYESIDVSSSENCVPVLFLMEYLAEETQEESPMASSLIRMAGLAYAEDLKMCVPEDDLCNQKIAMRC